MSSGDPQETPDFDAFLAAELSSSAERSEYERKILEITPTINDTLRQLGIPVYQDAPEDEINANYAALLLEQLQNTNSDSDDALTLAHMKIKANGIITLHAITLIQLKEWMLFGAENPDQASENKDYEMARQLMTGEIEPHGAWFKAFDTLLPGEAFNPESEAARRGFESGLQALERLEQQDERRTELALALTDLTADLDISEGDFNYLVTSLIIQGFKYTHNAADAEADIDALLRETGTQHLKSAVMALLAQFN